jgi:transcriptional regulator of met regulon
MMDMKCAYQIGNSGANCSIVMKVNTLRHRASRRQTGRIRKVRHFYGTDLHTVTFLHRYTNRADAC